MEKIKIFVEEIINWCGMTGAWVPYMRHLIQRIQSQAGLNFVERKQIIQMPL